MPIDFASTTEEKVEVRLSPRTTQGNASRIEGDPVVEVLSGNGTYVAATQEQKDADVAAGLTGLAGYVVSEDVDGTTQFKVSGDADLGAGVQTISDLINYTYTSPLASNLGLSGGRTLPK